MTFENTANHTASDDVVEDDAVYFQLDDEEAQLAAISIRLPKQTIENFKIIATYHKMNYQALMREALGRFADSEFKRIAIEAVNRQLEKDRKSEKRKLAA